MPGAPQSPHLSALAEAAGKEIILHLPLQPASAEDATDPGTLHIDMTRSEFAATFDRHLAAVPAAAGVNGHRGSLLTRHPGHMGWLMAELKSRPALYFVDSYTTAKSVALDIALENGVRAVRRDVFLDPDPAPATIEREFRRLKTIAREQGFAVGIAHPLPETLAVLERELPALAAAGFRQVTVGELIGAGGPGHDEESAMRLNIGAE